MKKPAFFNWSGGKDSALALFYSLKSGEYDIRYLLTSINSEYKRISMHGVREELLVQQVASIGLKLKKLYLPEFSPMETYNEILSKALHEIKREGIEFSIFGDIFLEDIREYREKQLTAIGMKAEFPLWKNDTGDIMKEFIDLGFKTIVTCVNEEYLDKTFVGRVIDSRFLTDLPDNVDPCGENGEFHTFVFDGPIFKYPISYSIGEKTFRKYENENDPHLKNGFWFCDLLTPQ